MFFPTNKKYLKQKSFFKNTDFTLALQKDYKKTVLFLKKLQKLPQDVPRA